MRARYRALREWLWYVNRRTQVRTGFYIWSPR